MQALQQLRALQTALQQLVEADGKYARFNQLPLFRSRLDDAARHAIDYVERTANGVIKSSTPIPDGASDAAVVPKYAFALARYGGDECHMSFEYLVGLLLSGTSIACAACTHVVQTT